MGLLYLRDCISSEFSMVELDLFFTVLFYKIFYQVLALFPSSQGLEVTWSSVVKIGQSLYREGPGKDPFRPDQKTPVKNFFLAGSYTKQVIFILPGFSYFVAWLCLSLCKYNNHDRSMLIEII